MRLPWLAVALLVAGSLAGAQDTPDFAPDGRAWNGTSRFVALARELAPRVRTPRTLSFDTIDARDVLVLIGPGRPLPERDLVEFVRHGGQLVIADDFGTAGPLLGRFGIRRTEVGATAAPRIRGHDELLVARPFYAHPLTEGIGVVVTNRPALLEHPRLVPLLGLDEGGGAVLLTGVVGEGRVVAISDPSLFVDEMMALTGNRRLAGNLVRFTLDDGNRRDFVIAAGDVHFDGTYDGGADGPLRARIQAALAALAHVRLPDDALRVAAVCLAGLGALLFASLRARRTEPALPWMAPGPSRTAETSGAGETLADLLRLSAERRLSLRPGASRSERERAVRTLGLPPAEERRMLAALAAIGARSKRGVDVREARTLASTWNAWLERKPDRNRMDN